MTTEDVISLVRRQLNDDHAGSGVRWSNAVLTKYINCAQHELMDRRQDILLKSDGTLATVANVTSLADVLSDGLTEEWKSALSSYVLYLCFSEDDADTVNPRKAERHLRDFEERLE